LIEAWVGDQLLILCSALGQSAAAALRRPLLASMGMDGFERQTLFQLLSDHPEVQLTDMLAGAIERVTFRSAACGYCVLRSMAGSYRKLITMTAGHATWSSNGERFTGNGREMAGLKERCWI
jgi:hypothetical protein